MYILTRMQNFEKTSQFFNVKKQGGCFSKFGCCLPRVSELIDDEKKAGVYFKERISEVVILFSNLFCHRLPNSTRNCAQLADKANSVLLPRGLSISAFNLQARLNINQEARAYCLLVYFRVMGFQIVQSKLYRGRPQNFKAMKSSPLLKPFQMDDPHP